MIDHRTTHRCLLADIASGHNMQYGKPSQLLNTLLLIGFVTRKPHADTLYKLSLTDAGHQYLAGLWH